MIYLARYIVITTTKVSLPVLFVIFFISQTHARVPFVRGQRYASAPDSIPPDSAKPASADTLDIPKSKSALEAEVKYKAKDSIVFDLVEKKVYLYGNAHIDYKTTQLDAAFITIDYTTNDIHASGMPDSTGKLTGKPVFKEGADEFKPDSIDYNFKSKKGLIYGLTTKEGDGYIHTEKVVTRNNGQKDIIYGRNAGYTTCDLEEPHFMLRTKKLKLIPQEKIITGPAYLEVEGVPLPLILPFGFFPASSRKTSGIIPPTVGESATQGFALRNGGFYFGNSDYFDMLLTGDIYTGGSYNVNVASKYAKRYKYNGGISFSYARNQFGLKETPDFNIQKNFKVNWVHSQDPKANPGSSFAANVNGGTANYLKSNSFRTSALFTQTFNSSISYSKSFTNSPFSFASSLQHDQNLATGQINFTLPQLSFNMSRIYPFRPKITSGRKLWYQDIGITYSSSIQNILNTSDSTLREDLDIRNFRNGMTNVIPISTSFKLFNYITLSPTINNVVNVYTKRTIREYDNFENKQILSTEDGVYATYAGNASLNMNTQLYGTTKFKRGRVSAIRHVISPNLSLQYRPDYGSENFGYYYKARVDSQNEQKRQYTYYENALYSAPGAGEVGALGFGFGNNIEMKLRNPKDTANPFKKIKLIESLSFGSSYNFLADSFRLQPVSINGFTTLFERFNIQAGATLDPYYIDSKGKKYKTYDWDERRRLGTVTAGNFNFSGRFNKKAVDGRRRIFASENPFIQLYYPYPYADFDVPWNLNFSYNMGYFKSTFVENNNTIYKGRTNHTLSFNGDLNLTDNWKITFTSGYDITNRNFNTSNFTVYRDLHCWQMSFQWIPFGDYKSYFFSIHIKAPSLQDLKLDKQRSFYDF